MNSFEQQTKNGIPNLIRVKLGENLSVFLVCLFITFLFWFLNAFTKNYTTQLEVPLKYVHLPKDQIVVNDLPTAVNFEINGFGFKLLSFYFFGGSDSIVIDYEDGIKRSRRLGKVCVIPKERIKELANLDLPAEVQIESLNIDSLKIFTDPLSTKEVKILPAVNYTLKNQFFLKDSISVYPNKVLVSGPVSYLDNLTSISTETLVFNELEKQITKDVDLVFPKKIAADLKQVRINIPIDQKTEKTVHVPVDINYDLDSVQLNLFPGKVEVKVVVGMAEYDQLTAQMFKFQVNASEIHSGKSYLLVRNVSAPGFVQVVDYTPKRLEYIIKK